MSRVENLLKKTAADSKIWVMLDRKPMTIAFLNQHGVNTAVRSKEFYDFLMGSDFLLRDGIGVKLALKLFGLGATENLNGTDLISQMIPHYKTARLAIFGASDRAVAACKTRLETEGVQTIVAMENGYHPDEFYIRRCAEAQADLVILCMGMPRQELLAARLKKENTGVMIICGGGWVDFYSGVKKRAPLWVRKLSLEWLHRLAMEPQRLGKRYTVDIAYYFYLILLARLQKA